MMGRIKQNFLIKDQQRPHLANCSSIILLQVVSYILGVGHSPNTGVSVMGYGRVFSSREKLSPIFFIRGSRLVLFVL